VESRWSWRILRKSLGCLETIFTTNICVEGSREPDCSSSSRSSYHFDLPLSDHQGMEYQFVGGTNFPEEIGNSMESLHVQKS
jgi:hypothetical protein